MKYRAEVYYRFKKAKTGVCLGMDIEADDDDEAMAKAKASCIGPRWRSRIWLATNIELARPPSPHGKLT